MAKTVIDRLEQFSAVALIGPRQVGKAILAQEITDGRPSLYLDLEMPADGDKLSDATLYLFDHTDKLVILDEVQRAPLKHPLLLRRSVLWGFVALQRSQPGLTDPSYLCRSF